VVDDTNNRNKPITHQRDLAKLPRALASLIARPQWAIWRWTRKPNGSWQKPPYQAMQPDAYASTSDPDTWADYEAALDAVQTGRADGISYMLAETDPFAAIDLDHCRDPRTHSIDVWAQNFMQCAVSTYQEVTPSGAGIRIWGLANGGNLHRKFSLEIDGKLIAAELFRRTNKALTVTGYKLDTIHELTNIDRVFDWAVVWGERRKAAAAAAAEQAASASGNGFNGGGNGSGYSIEQIERIVREGAPAGENRSDTFHAIVGHYLGCGWSAEQILAHLQQFPNGIGERYLNEGRLSGEIARSICKFSAAKLPPLFGPADWTSTWEAKAPEPLSDDPELQDDSDKEELLPDQDNEPEAAEQLPQEPHQEPVNDPDLDDDELNDEDKLNNNKQWDPTLPPMYAHGDPDPRPLKSWLVKGRIPTCGHGLLSGQWGTYKSFVALEFATALMTSQPFLGSIIKRQCGVLFLAAEGADEMRLRLNAAVREKCGNMPRAPFRWYETAPVLLQKGAVEKLVAMARQAEASLMEEFGLPLGLVIIDTIVVSAGYPQPGAENDPAVGQALMNVLKEAAQRLSCFVLGVDHYGKDITAGTRGTSAKEASADVVLACLGAREQSGRVTNTRLAVRKCRGGPQGEEFFFTARKVEEPAPDEEGDPITTLVVDWTNGPGPTGTQGPPDPWETCRRSDQQTAVTRLKRVLMAILADRGVSLPAAPDGPVVRMVDRELVREEFYTQTAADGTPEQKWNFRRMQFSRAVDWAERQGLISAREIGDVTYLWLTHSKPKDDGEEA
jgi:hypothetical protein